MLFVLLPAAAAGCAALAVLVRWPRSRAALPGATGAAAACSLAVTALHPDGAGGPPAGTVGTLEALLLVALVVPTARFAPPRRAVPAVAAAGLAAALWVLRSWSPGMGGTTAGGCAFWSLAAGAAAAGGCWLRSLDGRRAREAREARRRQRLELAADLHDFVAHEVSEMLAQAQAGGYLGESDPAVAVAALRRIEEAGLRALASMDRTVRMLREQAPPAAPGLEELPSLVARFGSANGAPVHLEVDRELPGRVPRELSATAYRVVVEALTNVRRHAPDAPVTVRVEGPSPLLVRVGNGRPGGRARPSGGRRGGIGLAGLAERVAALGGTLSAGPDRDGGWLLTAELPGGAR
ncbi:two-component sensor histidine kinase [Kitasatospora sp. NA04385]|uniref:sensor histidine kinase n=1 Tax=Kitasatospora sp. NA04385 TaxID=2742135 RepID=UPI001592A43C|nr:histidine kinase [Kitasatospora sp. NA04385]QKW21244.1 two-component sensor histidine kinase [Kitasatospora sp. NA04385]